MAWLLAAAMLITVAVDAGASEGPPKPGGKCAVSAVGERSNDVAWVPAAIGLWFCFRRRRRR
ncbi:MAG TPA: hypothetical protein VFB62_26190 [Polyangiaceae bacterium]|nr:hypothetical protein [Polyangiaceae bacterium]